MWLGCNAGSPCLYSVLHREHRCARRVHMQNDRRYCMYCTRRSLQAGHTRDRGPLVNTTTISRIYQRPGVRGA